MQPTKYFLLIFVNRVPYSTPNTDLTPNQGNAQAARRNKRRQESQPFNPRTLLIPGHLHIQLRISISFQIQHAPHAEEDATYCTYDRIFQPAKEGHERVGSGALEEILMTALDAVECISVLMVFGDSYTRG